MTAAAKTKVKVGLYGVVSKLDTLSITCGVDGDGVGGAVRDLNTILSTVVNSDFS